MTKSAVHVMEGPGLTDEQREATKLPIQYVSAVMEIALRTTREELIPIFGPEVHVTMIVSKGDKAAGMGSTMEEEGMADPETMERIQKVLEAARILHARLQSKLSEKQ